MKIVQKVRTLGKYDIQKDSFGKILFSIGTPLLIVNVMNIFCLSLMNDLYSRYAGSLYFTVTGAIVVVTDFSLQAINAVISAVWIRNVSFYVLGRGKEAERNIANSFYTVVFSGLLVSVILVTCTKLFLKILYVPEEIYAETRNYYVVYMGLLVVSGMAILLRTINDGLGNSMDIFIGNFTNAFGGAVAAVLLLVVLKMGFAGTPLLPFVNSLFLIIVCVICLKRRDFHVLPKAGYVRPDPKIIWRNLRYALLLILQIGLCTVGDLLVTAQTNKCLSLEYIGVTSVSLPITNPMGIMSSVCMIFLPQNYKKGNALRVREFLRRALGITVLYGMFCSLMYAGLGKWYYARLFDDAETVAMGQEYWLWYGSGFVFLAVIYVIRYFFDAIGMGKVSLVSGIGELLGKLICAFWLIPKYGNIGRTLTYPLGWMFGAVFLLIAYAVLRKKIYFTIQTER